MAKKWNIAALYTAHETAFGTDPSASGAGFKFIKAREATFQPQADVIERPGLVNDLGRQEHAIGVKGGTLAFQLEMKGSGTAAGSGVVAIASESSEILESVMGSVVRGTGDTVQIGSTSTVVNVTDGTRFPQFSAVCIGGEVRFVVSVAGNALTLDRALSAAPATSTVVYASSLFTRATTGHKSLAFVAIRDGIQYTFLGCKASCRLAGFTARGTALLDVTIDVGDWEVSSKASLPVAALAGVTLLKAPVVKGAPFAVDGVEETIHNLDFDPGHRIEFIESTAGLQGKAGIELVEANPSGSINPYYAASHLADFFAGTSKEFAFAAGDQTNGFGVFIPRAQYGQPTLEDKNGMVGEAIPFMVNDNGTGADFAISQF